MLITDNRVKLPIEVNRTFANLAANWIEVEAQTSSSFNDVNTPQNSYRQNNPLLTQPNKSREIYVLSMPENVNERALIKIVDNDNKNTDNIAIVGNTLYKNMQDIGVIADIANAPASIIPKLTINFSRLLSETYVDSDQITHYYWALYACKNERGFKWDVKAMLENLFVGFGDGLSSSFCVQSLVDDFPRATSTATISFITSVNSDNRTISTAIALPANTPDYLNFTRQKRIVFGAASGPNVRLTTYFVGLGYTTKVKVTNLLISQDVIFLKASTYDGFGGGAVTSVKFTADNFLGGVGIAYDAENNTYNNVGSWDVDKEYTIDADEYYWAVNRSLFKYACTHGGSNDDYFVLQNVTTTTTILEPLKTTAHIYEIMPPFDVKTLLQMYQAATGKELQWDYDSINPMAVKERENTIYTDPLLSYSVQYNNVPLYKGLANYVQVDKGDTDEEPITIQTISLNSNYFNGLDAEAEIVTLPSREYWVDGLPNLANKSYKMAVECTAKMDYDTFRRLENIMIMQVEAVVIKGKWKKGIATLQCLVPE